MVQAEEAARNAAIRLYNAHRGPGDPVAVIQEPSSDQQPSTAGQLQHCSLQAAQQPSSTRQVAGTGGATAVLAGSSVKQDACAFFNAPLAFPAAGDMHAPAAFASTTAQRRAATAPHPPLPRHSAQALQLSRQHSSAVASASGVTIKRQETGQRKRTALPLQQPSVQACFVPGGSRAARSQDTQQVSSDPDSAHQLQMQAASALMALQQPRQVAAGSQAVASPPLAGAGQHATPMLPREQSGCHVAAASPPLAAISCEQPAQVIVCSSGAPASAYSLPPRLLASSGLYIHG